MSTIIEHDSGMWRGGNSLQLYPKQAPRRGSAPARPRPTTGATTSGRRADDGAPHTHTRPSGGVVHQSTGRAASRAGGTPTVRPSAVGRPSISRRRRRPHPSTVCGSILAPRHSSQHRIPRRRRGRRRGPSRRGSVGRRRGGGRPVPLVGTSRTTALLSLFCH